MSLLYWPPQGSPIFLAESPECEYLFTWQTPSACALTREQGDNCTVEDKQYGYMFNLSTLYNRTSDYDVSVSGASGTRIVLNVCNKLVSTPKECTKSKSGGACIIEGEWHVLHTAYLPCSLPPSLALFLLPPFLSPFHSYLLSPLSLLYFPSILISYFFLTIWYQPTFQQMEKVAAHLLIPATTSHTSMVRLTWLMENPPVLLLTSSLNATKKPQGYKLAQRARRRVRNYMSVSGQPHLLADLWLTYSVVFAMRTAALMINMTILHCLRVQETGKHKSQAKIWMVCHTLLMCVEQCYWKEVQNIAPQQRVFVWSIKGMYTWSVLTLAAVAQLALFYPSKSCFLISVFISSAHARRHC